MEANHCSCSNRKSVRRNPIARQATYLSGIHQASPFILIRNHLEPWHNFSPECSLFTLEECFLFVGALSKRLCPLVQDVEIPAVSKQAPTLFAGNLADNIKLLHVVDCSGHSWEGYPDLFGRACSR